MNTNKIAVITGAGSGIGLALSRQILLKQKLSLSLRERHISGYNATFEIEGYWL